jgi:hypothetical protein
MATRLLAFWAALPALIVVIRQPRTGLALAS